MELRRKSEHQAAQQAAMMNAMNPNAPSSPPRTAAAVSAIQNFSRVGTNRLNNFFANRANPTPTPAPARPTTPDALDRSSIESQVVTELSNQLSEEKKQREMAEKALADVKGELEDLSVTLFQQANEMVSTERKARAKLEDRVAMLEKRDIEKGMRLDQLQRAMQRINRVKGILADKPVFKLDLP